MKIDEFFADGYKNLKNAKICPCDGVNLIYGQNAQGKTNLLEAIGLFSGEDRLHLKSAKKIAFGRDFAELRLKFSDSEREQTAKAVLSQKNQFFLNEVPIKRATEIYEQFHSISFSPANLSIIQGDSRARRKFLDDAIAKLKPGYLKYCKQYEKILAHRNFLLKSGGLKSSNTLEVWNEKMAQIGTIITMIRQDYVEKMSQVLAAIYREISGGRESLEIKYESTVFDRKLKNTYSEDDFREYIEKLEFFQTADFDLGHTKIGIHRDDLAFKLENLNAREYGSQGQQRSCVIALKLAQAKLFKLICRRNPVILLDDVMSELDVDRQKYILNQIQGSQMFITCCDISSPISFKNAKIYKVEDGKVYVY